MTEIQKQIEALQEQAEELTELREDVFNVKSDITITAVGLLLEKLDDALDDMVNVAKKQKYFDEGLAGVLKSTITEAINAFAKVQPPTVNVEAAKVTVDMKPMQEIAGEIGKSQEVIKSLLQRIESANGNGQTQELVRLVTAMIGKNNAFIEKGFQVINYSAELREIGTAITKRATEWEANVTKRNQAGQLEQVIIKTTK